MRADHHRGGDAASEQDRLLPVSVEAERSILGAILLNSAAYNQGAEHLKAEDFSLDSHRRIYSCMRALAESSRPVDMVLLTEELERRKELEGVGGVGYVSGLVDGVPDRPSIEHYVRIVKQKATLRSTIRLMDNITARCYEGREPVEEILGASAEGVRRLQEGHYLATTCGRIRTWEQIPTLDQLPAQDVSWVVKASFRLVASSFGPEKAAPTRPGSPYCLLTEYKPARDFWGERPSEGRCCTWTGKTLCPCFRSVASC